MGGGNPVSLLSQGKGQPLAQDTDADESNAGSPSIQGATQYVGAHLSVRPSLTLQGQKENHARAWYSWGISYLLWPSRSTFDPSGPLTL